MRQLTFVGVLVITGWTAQAEPVPLAGDGLKQAVAGKTVHLDTPFGIAIPITYQANGLMSGKAGVLEYFLGAEADRGRWWIAGGKLCQKWFKWLDAQPSCMRLSQDGYRLFWRRDDGLSGTATIVASLAPGAEKGPHGLGGPVDTAELRQSLSTTQASATAKPANIDLAAASLPRAAKRTVVKAAALVAQQPQVRQLIGAGGWSKSANDHREVTVTSGGTATEQDYRWCYAPVVVAAASSTPVPDLIFVARLPYAGSEVPSAATACLTAELALRHAATLGIDVR